MPARIYALAKDLNLENKQVVEICHTVGIVGKDSALASLSDCEIEKVKSYAAAQKQAVNNLLQSKAEAQTKPKKPTADKMQGITPVSRPSPQTRPRIKIGSQREQQSANFADDLGHVDTSRQGNRVGPMTIRLFLSYRREDTIDFAGRIYDRLISRFTSQSVFIDQDSIPLGVDFRKHLAEAVASCQILLAIIGKNWLGQSKSDRYPNRLFDPRDFVRIEIEAALNREVPVVPVLVGGASMPDENQLPECVQPLIFRNAAEVRSDRHFNNDAKLLIRGLERLMHRVP
jgi:hypothetical protein